MAKIVTLRPVLGDEIWWLAVVAAINIALGIAVYLRWLALLIGPAPLTQPAAAAEEPAAAAPAGAPRVPWRLWLLVALLTLALVWGSISPVGIL